MILYVGDKELFNFIFAVTEDISSDITMSEADKLIISEYSHNAISLIRYAVSENIPVLGILDGFKSVAETFGIECICVDCPEGKEELAILDTNCDLYKNLSHVTTICRGNPFSIAESAINKDFDCAARAENGEIISVCARSKSGQQNVFALNYYLTSSITQKGNEVIKNFVNL